MGELWLNKYGRKKPTQSARWMAKYGQKRKIADYDPNQPRDNNGRWTSGGAGSINPEHKLSVRVHGVPYLYRELAERMKDRPNELQMLVDVDVHHAELTAKYPGAKSLGVDIRPAPSGNPTGWVEAGEGDHLKNELRINVNHNFSSIQRLAKNNLDSELKTGDQGRFLQFNKDRIRPQLAEDGFDIDAFLKKHPDYPKARGFTVPDPSRANDITSFVKNTVTHEFAHVLHLGSGKEMYDRINPVAQKLFNSPRLKMISEYAELNHFEAWAETFTFYRNYPAMADDILPGEIISFIKSLEG